jgi:hypothetical protein
MTSTTTLTATDAVKIAVEYVRIVTINKTTDAVVAALTDDLDAIEIMYELDETGGSIGLSGLFGDDKLMDAAIAVVSALLAR